jgi:hypothetical protein
MLLKMEHPFLYRRFSGVHITMIIAGSFPEHSDLENMKETHSTSNREINRDAEEVVYCIDDFTYPFLKSA